MSLPEFSSMSAISLSDTEFVKLHMRLCQYQSSRTTCALFDHKLLTIHKMKLIIATLPVFLLFLSVQAEMGKGWPEAAEKFRSGGDTLSNVFLLAGTLNVANIADKLELLIQNGITQGRAYLKVLSEMMRTMDVSPDLKETVQMIQLDIQALESAMDDIERNARLRSIMVKATADCVAPQRGAIAKIKDEMYMALVGVVETQRDALMDILAAGQSIQEQVRILQDIEIKIVRAMLNNENERLADLVEAHRTPIETNIRIIQKTYMSAVDDYNGVTMKSVRKLAEALQKSQITGRKILEAVENCMQPNGNTNGVE